MTTETLTKKVLALALTIAALAAGQNAAAQVGTFTVTNTSGSTFTVTRTSNTDATEKVMYRTVSLSAIAGTHFTAASGTLTFDAEHNTRTVTVEEKTPTADAYKYQTAASRQYRFEVTDLGGTVLASKDRSITSGTLSGYVLIDDSYDYAQKPATVSTATLIGSTGAPASYLSTLGYKIYATVCFTEKEKDDGYQYLQIVAGTASASYDTGADKEGQVYDPVNSVYKVCFEFANGSNAEGKIFFPHRSTSSSEFSNSDGVLHQQKYKSDDNWMYDGSGAVILPVTTSSITTRFDAGGNNDDTGSGDVTDNDGAVQADAVLNESETVPVDLSGTVAFRREFTAGKASTICLPFAMTTISGGKVYEFAGVTYDATDGWVATMSDATPGGNNMTTTEANKPYLFLPDATGIVMFGGTAAATITAGETTSGDWTFLGTYSEVKWDEAPTGIYGFSAQNVDEQGISQGEFVKVGAKVKIRPLRAYLQNENFSAARAMTRGSGELPNRIIVRLVGSNGNTTGIGTLDTRTGEVEIESWYDLNGRKLSGKPTQRAIYINNGKKIAIK